MHVAIAGNIGAGKTTLTQMLAAHYGWRPHFEAVIDNPYLSDFYADMQRWSFNLQIYFLSKRYEQIIDFRSSGVSIVQDRSIYEDAYIFASNLCDMGLLLQRDYDNYKALFKLMEQHITPPDLIIYLKGSLPKLLTQIRKRGRSYEQDISANYLEKLNHKYNAWAENYSNGKLLTIDIDTMDFVENTAHFQYIINKIEESGVLKST